jgi:hypothetical protein
MKQVELVRKHITMSMLRLRSYVSCIDGNVEVVDRLKGEEGEKRLARIIAFILSELGHETDTPVEAAASHVRRTLKKASTEPA